MACHQVTVGCIHAIVNIAGHICYIVIVHRNITVIVIITVYNNRNSNRNNNRKAIT